jgi:hypothetical protein
MGIMADKISVDELKIFVGTGLKIYDTHKENWPELFSVSEQGFDIDDCSGEWPIDPNIGGAFKPMVRPLSNLTKEEMVKAEFIKPNPGDNIDWYFLKCIYTSIIHDGSGSYKSMMYLSSKHYDIFNWLNRTGEDGTPLAVEFTDNV